VLTVQGWIVALVAVVLVTAGRLFGIFELFLLGAGAVALVIAAAVAVWRTHLRLDIARSVHPPRVHVGGPSRIDLAITNCGKRRSPMLTLHDPVGDGRSASVVVAPLAPGESVRASYRLPTDRRGVLHVGPLSVQIADPYGLASATSRAAPVVDLTIWPAVDDVPPLPHTSGDDPHGGADHPNVLSSNGDDFYALRPYVVGDDLRHVHWKSTARRDDLMVRQDEMPWQGRATVLLDNRRHAHTADSFEWAVSAAASIVVACNHRRFLLRLLTTSGHDSGIGSGQAHVELILEQLAVVALDDTATIAGAAAVLRRNQRGAGAVTLLLGGSDVEADAVDRLRRGVSNCTVVLFRDDAEGVAGRGVHVVDRERTFAAVWPEAMRRGVTSVRR
jgi:uncharacterized protein (DUF58 family)